MCTVIIREFQNAITKNVCTVACKKNDFSIKDELAHIERKYVPSIEISDKQNWV